MLTGMFVSFSFRPTCSGHLRGVCILLGIARYPNINVYNYSQWCKIGAFIGAVNRLVQSGGPSTIQEPTCCDLAGRFEARIGIAGSKHIYLGLFSAESEAARSYDRAVVRIKGLQASTNFHLSDYSTQVTEHELKHLEVCCHVI